MFFHCSTDMKITSLSQWYDQVMEATSDVDNDKVVKVMEANHQDFEGDYSEFYDDFYDYDKDVLEDDPIIKGFSGDGNGHRVSVQGNESSVSSFDNDIIRGFRDGSQEVVNDQKFDKNSQDFVGNDQILSGNDVGVHGKNGEFQEFPAIDRGIHKNFQGFDVGARSKTFGSIRNPQEISHLLKGSRISTSHGKVWNTYMKNDVFIQILERIVNIDGDYWHSCTNTSQKEILLCVSGWKFSLSGSGTLDKKGKTCFKMETPLKMIDASQLQESVRGSRSPRGAPDMILVWSALSWCLLSLSHIV